MRGLKWWCIDICRAGRSRTPQGVRGLKLVRYASVGYGLGRTPQGVRGLKLLRRDAALRDGLVAPRKGCVD